MSQETRRPHDGYNEQLFLPMTDLPETGQSLKPADFMADPPFLDTPAGRLAAAGFLRAALEASRRSDARQESDLDRAVSTMLKSPDEAHMPEGPSEALPGQTDIWGETGGGNPQAKRRQEGLSGLLGAAGTIGEKYSAQLARGDETAHRLQAGLLVLHDLFSNHAGDIDKYVQKFDPKVSKERDGLSADETRQLANRAASALALVQNMVNTVRVDSKGAEGALFLFRHKSILAADPKASLFIEATAKNLKELMKIMVTPDAQKRDKFFSKLAWRILEVNGYKKPQAQLRKHSREAWGLYIADYVKHFGPMSRVGKE